MKQLEAGSTVTLSETSQYLGKDGNPKSTEEKGTVVKISDHIQVTWSSGLRNSYSKHDLVVVDELEIANSGHMWLHNKGKYVFDDPELPTVSETLKPGMYQPILDPMSGNIVGLKVMKSEFDFNYKIYDLDTAFIERVLKTFDKTTGNLGILLDGIKGTGKSVTAKIICNKLRIPIIIVESKIPNLGPYLNNFKQDVGIFIDEFEKVYDIQRDDKAQDKLLTTMDGVYNNEYKKMFILTSNNKNINTNLKDRPTRLRYIKSYGNLSIEAIEMIVDDLLEHKELADVVVKFISSLELITVDIVKNVIQEVNIHNEDPELFASIFNVTKVKATLFVEFYNMDKELIETKSLLNFSKKGFEPILDGFEDKNNHYYRIEGKMDEATTYHDRLSIPRIGLPDQEGMMKTFKYNHDENTEDDQPYIHNGYVKAKLVNRFNPMFNGYF